MSKCICSECNKIVYDWIGTICASCYQAALIAPSMTKTTEWKDSWFYQRDSTGKVAWEVPPPSYLSDKQKDAIHITVLQQYAELFEKRMRAGLLEMRNRSIIEMHNRDKNET